MNDFVTDHFRGARVHHYKISCDNKSDYGKEGISTDEITKEAIKLVIFDITFRDLVYDQVYLTLIAEQAPLTPAGLPETPG